MCGLTGYLSNKNFDHLNLLNRMGQAIAHRGPDASGIWFDENSGIAFCHRRLSIIDLSEAGAQPMLSASGNFVMVFNGEIYNFQQIRKKLESTNGKVAWRGHSDTEVILAAVEAWGIEKALQEMIGMFAIALWDKSKRELTLARDRMGEKPLYFGWQNESFLFGSELKSFHQHPDFKKEICMDALGKYFKYNYIPSGISIYKSVQKLTPGTFCKVSLADKQVKHFTYWSLNDHVGNKKAETYNANESVNQLEALLKDAIGKQMISDVPLGAFLSGGIDSSTIVALMQAQSTQAVKTFSIGFNEKGFDEAVYAKQVARHLGTDHTELYVSSEQAQSVIPLISGIYDEPFSDSSQIPTYLVSKLAKSKVTVSLSGDAGDELFSGYNRYLMVNNVWSKLSKLPKSARRSVGRFLLSLDVESLNRFYGSVENIIPQKYKLSNFGDKMHKIAARLDASSQSELYDSFISHWNVNEILNQSVHAEIYNLEQIHNLSFIERMMYMDGKTYLPDDILVKVDRAAMANSLETRVPFLDHRVVEFAWNLPMSLKIKEGKGKWILREVLYKHVPKSMIERPKMGFGIPLDEWLRGPLKEWAYDTLSSSNLNKHGFFNNSAIHEKLDQHTSKRRNWQYQLWDVLMFQNWYDKYC